MLSIVVPGAVPILCTSARQRIGAETLKVGMPLVGELSPVDDVKAGTLFVPTRQMWPHRFVAVSVVLPGKLGSPAVDRVVCGTLTRRPPE